MKAKMARKAVRHAKPMRKSIRGKKHARAAAHASKKEKAPTVPAEQEMIQATFEAPVEFVEVDLEPVVEVFEVYESEGGEEDES
jgi:hypothetical protein